MRINGLSARGAAILFCAFGAIQTPPIAAQANDPGFTAADLLKWSEEGRNSYFNTAVGMMGAVMSQDQSGYGTCIGEWYFGQSGDAQKANAELTGLLARFPGYDPRGIIISVVRQKCGALPLKNGG